MNDDKVDALIDGLRSKGPIPSAPVLPDEDRRPARWRWAVGMAIAAAILLAVGAWQVRPDDRVGVRGGEGTPAVDLQLEVTVQRGEQVTRVGSGQALQLDDTLYFKVRAQPATSVGLWVEDGGQRIVLAEVDATAEGTVVRSGGGLLGYRPDAAGTLRIGAVGADVERVLEVEVVGRR